MMNMVPSKAM